MTNGAGKPPGQEVKPFITKDVTCPICELPSPQRRLKRHLYVEKSRDVDLRPLGFQWTKKGLEQYHPPLYYLWRCPHCRFTGWPGAFENPVRSLGLTLGRLRSILLEASEQDPAVARVMTKLTQGLGAGVLDFPQGVRLHLLALYELQVIRDKAGAQDALNQGRYGLRLAWLFRDLEERPELAEAQAQVRALLAGLGQDWPGLPVDAQAAAELALEGYEAVVRDSRAVEDVAEACNLLLLIARINLKLRRPDPARQHWSKAFELVRNVEASKRNLESQYYGMKERSRAEARAVAEMAKGKLGDLSAQIVEMDAKARSMRFKVQEIKDLIYDLAEDLAQAPAPVARPAQAQGQAAAPAPAPGQPQGQQKGQEQDQDFELDLSFETKKKKKKKFSDFFK